MNTTLTQLRDMVPIRALNFEEGLRIAELQASKLILLSGLPRAGAVPSEVVTKQPYLQVEQVIPHFASGSTRWAQGRWIITLNGRESHVRQRFTLAHEFKHVLDHRFIHLLYPPIGELSARDRGEQVANHFAVCLLMPRVWVQRAWETGSPEVGRLARLFHVSHTTMRRRLESLGLVPPSERCLYGVA